jgi:hypothetical protein
MSRTPDPARPSSPREHPLADPVLDALLTEVDAARRFEEQVLLASQSDAQLLAGRAGAASVRTVDSLAISNDFDTAPADGLGHMEHDALVRAPLPGRTAAWRTLRWAGVGLAAAASLLVGVLFVTKPASVGPGTSGGNVSGGRQARAITPTPLPTNDQRDPGSASAGTIRLVAGEGADARDLARFAYLDDGITTNGLPTLTGERELVMAIRTNGMSGGFCDCVSWSVGEPGSSTILKERVLQQTLGSGCDPTGLDPFGHDVVIVKVTGPRNELPMHDEDAQAWAACIVEAPSFCAQALAREDTNTGESQEDQRLCQQTVAGSCIPQGLAFVMTPLALASH